MRMSMVLSLVLFLWARPGLTQQRWYLGNTHTHTINSDGDAAPDAVVRWYREHGYHFVVLTDHDCRTPIDGLNAVFGAPGKFLIIAGVEVTDRFPRDPAAGTTALPVHSTGINVGEAVPPQGGSSIAETLRRDARAVRAAGGVPAANHPNFHWALTAEHIVAAEDVKHFELHNAHPLVNNRGGGGKPSTEEIWDQVLSTGRVLYALASDDAHHFYGEFTRSRTNPGRAGIFVRAAELTAAAIAAAIDRGDFYATTGVRLESYEADATAIRITLPQSPDPNARRYRTFFIGRGGTVLQRDDSLKPSYAFRGDELYVRARIEASDGSVAWTQPVFVGKQPPGEAGKGGAQK